MILNVFERTLALHMHNSKLSSSSSHTCTATHTHILIPPAFLPFLLLAIHSSWKLLWLQWHQKSRISNLLYFFTQFMRLLCCIASTTKDTTALKTTHSYTYMSIEHIFIHSLLYVCVCSVRVCVWLRAHRTICTKHKAVRSESLFFFAVVVVVFVVVVGNFLFPQLPCTYLPTHKHRNGWIVFVWRKWHTHTKLTILMAICICLMLLPLLEFI